MKLKELEKQKKQEEAEQKRIKREQKRIEREQKRVEKEQKKAEKEASKGLKKKGKRDTANRKGKGAEPVEESEQSNCEHPICGIEFGNDEENVRWIGCDGCLCTLPVST